MKKAVDLNAWRRMVASEHGPESPTTRLVLHTLAVHMDPAGGSCFPSTKKLSVESGLSERVVWHHLAVAANAGWILKSLSGKNGQGWKRNQYRATLPKALTESQQLTEKGTDAGSVPTQKGTDFGAEGTDFERKKALTQGQSSYSIELTKELLNNSSSTIPEIRLSKLLFEKMAENDPKAKKPDFEKWSVHIDRLMRLDKRPEQEIEAVILWSQANSFWKSNILSTKALREDFPRLFLQMKESKNGTIGNQARTHTGAGGGSNGSAEAGQGGPGNDQQKYDRLHQTSFNVG